jgi:hypothetical protein
MGNVQGSTTTTLGTGNLPPYTPSGSVTDGPIEITFGNGNTGGLNTTVGTWVFGSSGGTVGALDIRANQSGSTFTGSAQGGTSTPFSNIQPTLVAECVVVVLP